MPVAFLPSPVRAVWHLGPLPLRAYALCMVGGIVLGAWVAGRRYVQAGGQPGVMLDIAASVGHGARVRRGSRLPVPDPGPAPGSGGGAGAGRPGGPTTFAAFWDPCRAGKYAPVAESACNLRAIARR